MSYFILTKTKAVKVETEAEKKAKEIWLNTPADTLMLEPSFDIALSEYAIERGKKSSFETRACLVLTLLCSLLLFIFAESPFSPLLATLNREKNQVEFLGFLFQMLFFSAFVLSWLCGFYHTWKVLKIKKYQNISMQLLGEEYIAAKKMVAMPDLIHSYKRLIESHRKENEENAKSLRRAMEGLCASFFAIILYFLIT